MRTFYNFDDFTGKNVKEFYKPFITLRVNNFDEESFEDFEKDMDEAHQTKQPVIPVIVDSYGGSAYGCLGFVASIQSARLPVATILTSKAMSAGAILFCFGTEGYRYMHPHAHMMIHDVGTVVAGKLEDIKADTKQMEKLNESIYARVSEHLGHPRTFISDLIKQNNHVDWFLDAKKAKSLKIANHLKNPCFNVEVKTTITFG